MKTEKLEGTMDKAYGIALATPISYNGSFEVYENISEVKTANDMPNDDEVVAFRNSQRRNNMRQKFMTEALNAAGIVKPTLQSSEELRVKQIVDSLVAAGKTPEKALEIAQMALAAG